MQVTHWVTMMEGGQRRNAAGFALASLLRNRYVANIHAPAALAT
ncbi:hypothetical protein [Burkholderia lata]|nr:hypothetical protein [Burkholderia lata]